MLSATCFLPLPLRYELEEGEEAQVFCQRLTRLLGDLIYVGSKELRAKNSAIVEVFQLPGFQLNIPKVKGECWSYLSPSLKL